MTNIQIHHGNCLDVLPTLPDCSIDSIVTDPPYELGFMGKKWDNSGIAYNVNLWRECLRVLKPGGHLLAFGGTRTYHRMAVAIEDAGFEIRDSLHWIYGSGFPKSLNLSETLDKMAGAPVKVGKAFKVAGEYGGRNLRDSEPRGAARDEMRHEAVTEDARQWSGWGTALKPAHEPIVVARKPLVGTVASNVLQYGTGAINIDATRVDGNRWPANLIIDEIVAGMHPDWANYFYCAKPGKRERNAGLDHLPAKKNAGSYEFRADGSLDGKKTEPKTNHHPTVKPLALMRWLVRLVTPPNGTVLEPFAGSGTTLVACHLENFNAIGIEMTDEYLPIIEGRLAWAREQTEQQQLL